MRRGGGSGSSPRDGSFDASSNRNDRQQIGFTMSLLAVVGILPRQQRTVGRISNPAVEGRIGNPAHVRNFLAGVIRTPFFGITFSRRRRKHRLPFFPFFPVTLTRIFGTT